MGLQDLLILDMQDVLVAMAKDGMVELRYWDKQKWTCRWLVNRGPNFGGEGATPMEAIHNSVRENMRFDWDRWACGKHFWNCVAGTLRSSE